MSLFLRLALSFVVAVVVTTGAHAERRIALVIGNSAYSSVSPLANPKNDAELMAKTLQSVGFEVTKIVDADQHAMKQAMLEFGRKLRDGGVDASLFYYSGHGVQANGENYLVPVDAAIKDQGELDLQAVDVNAFLRVMQDSASKVNIVILDACRNNPFASSFRSASRGLAMVDAPRGTYIAYSTAPGDVAEDGSNGNSPYTQALAEAIVKPGVKLEDAFKDARRLVLTATGDKQVPWETTSITGDFYFVPEAAKVAPSPAPTPAVAAAPAAPPPSGEIAADHAAWLQIANSTDTEAFDRFLRAFPTSRFAADAKAREASLAAADPPKQGAALPAAGEPAAPQSGAVAADQPVQLAGLPSAGEAVAGQHGVFIRLHRWSSPAIALDRFHSAQRQYPQLLGDKQPNIEHVALDTGETAYRVRIGPFASEAEAADFCTRLKAAGGFCVMPDKRVATGAAASTDEPAVTPVHSTGKLQVPPSYTVDLDNGALAQTNADIWFEAVTPTQLFLVPRNGAELAPGDLSKRSFEACSSETYSTNRVSLHDVPPGSSICVKTHDGRIGSVRIDGLAPGAVHVLALNYVVWE